MVAKVEGLGEGWSGKAGLVDVIYIEWINKVLCIPQSTISVSYNNHNGKEYEQKCIYTYAYIYIFIFM